MKKVQEFLRENGERLVEHKILVGILSMVVAPSVFVLEALFYWPDAPSPLHDKVVSQEKLAQGKRYPGNPAARALVAEMRAGFAEVLASLGAAHLGAGRSMPYRQHRDPNSFALLQAIKDAADPSGIMNPGVLGLDVPYSQSFSS
jgi:D-lactate dehydrogenase (cytochrome)